MACRRLLVGVLAFATCSTVLAQDRIRVINEGGIRDEWTLPAGARLAVPAYPRAYAADPAEACVVIGYLLNPDGTTSDFALLKAWSAREPQRDRDAFWGAFAQDASNALARWKFEPRAEVRTPRPVYTAATFLFAATNAAELRKRCAIPNLALRLVELRQDTKAARRMAADGIFQRLDIDPTLESRHRDQLRRREESLRPPDKAPPPPPLPPPPPPGGGG
ncbi:MAG: hypothetical protein EOP93_04185 [Lysobacteraceae bacterium]|nr:MAG: hypothetical protein EOP93_04185 [Xanthomonadaceae bacterium]